MDFTVKGKVLRTSLLVLAVSLAVTLMSTALLASGPWQVLGPDGGDARSLAYDAHNPDRILLGTSTGQMFASNDGGRTWSRLARLGGDDYVLDHITIDPRDSNRIYVSAWSGSSQQIGEVFRTLDGGRTWETLPAMHGKSIRALAMHKGDSKVVVVGALDGVYRSTDGGDTWDRLSPANSADIKNIESIAVDPKDPNTVYAGTWHLAWKTSDGGANWQHINKGMIDDSDVFSVIVDHDNSSVVFASACSGIYKSENGGNLFAKIQGIPFSARRTRVLKQDPTNENIVYAGTTEGLWKSTDLGKVWKRVSNPEVVVNDVLIDPRDSNHVLLATDRSGVMASSDGALNWNTSNHGYAHRYVSSILADNKNSSTLYVGVVNDREYGGVFYSHDAGQTLAAESGRARRKRRFRAQASPERNAGCRHQPWRVFAGAECQRMAFHERRGDRAYFESHAQRFEQSGHQNKHREEGTRIARQRSGTRRSGARFRTLAGGNDQRHLLERGPGQNLEGRTDSGRAGFRFGAS